jgi:hypothetical protein
MNGRRTVWVVMCALLVPAGALAAPPINGGSRAPAEPMSASACTGLFGDERVRAWNASRRGALLDFIDEDESGVTVAHGSSRWEEPGRLRLEGMRLRAVQRGAAVVELSSELARSSKCLPGRYRLKTDDLLAARTRILGVLANGILVEHRGRLGFIGGRTPRWLMAWRMQGEVHMLGTHRHVFHLRKY